MAERIKIFRCENSRRGLRGMEVDMNEFLARLQEQNSTWSFSWSIGYEYVIALVRFQRPDVVPQSRP